MNMSEDVAGATLQVTSKVAEVGSHAMTKVIDLIAKLFDAWMMAKRSSAAAKSQKVKSTDLTNIKPGAVSIKSLLQSARASGDQVVFSEQGITKSDQKYITEKARQFGIPVAFVQADGKDNIFVQVRKSDLPVFQKICTDRMKDKLAERPQTLGNFKVQAWEMPFLTNELNHYDLAASFGVTRDGERFCLYEKADEKAILIAREEFHRKCEDIEQDLSFSKGEDGFYTLRSSGNETEISFDELPSREELATQIGEKFGYDENKAQIACAKFAEEMLHGEEKTRFFSEDPQQEFSSISGNISVEGEDVRCKAFTCWRVTPKADEMPRIVFRDTDGKFAVLSPETQSAKQMQAVLRESLGVEDADTLNALTDKAQKVSDSCIAQINMTLDVVRVVNLIEMAHSNNYNPFHYVYDQNGDLSEDNVKKMVNVLFKSTKGDGEKDDFWSQKGQTLLEAIVFLLFEESEYNAEFDENGRLIPESRDIVHLNFFSVTEKMRGLQYPPHGSQIPDGFFLERNADEDEAAFRKRQNEALLCPLDKDFIELEKRKPDSLALRLYKEVRNAPEETGQSFLSSANVKTFMFNLINLQNLTCCDNVELEKLGDRKTALFLILSATDSTYNFMAAMLYTQLFDVLANRANFKYGGTLPIHVRCIMDEFANLGQIPDFDKVIAFVRSMGMSLNVIVQNLAQLKARYEKT